MLRSLQIRRFRSCHDVYLDNLGSVVALVGHNGAGKTNILKSVHWLGSHATIPESIKFDAGGGWIGSKFVTKDGIFRYTVSVDLVANKPLVREIIRYKARRSSTTTLVDRRGEDVRLVNGEQVKVGLASSVCYVLPSILPSTHEIQGKLTPLLEELRAIRYFPLDEMSTSDDEPIVMQKTDSKGEASSQDEGNSSHSISSAIVALSRSAPEKFNEIKRLLGPNGINLIDIEIGEYPFDNEKLQGRRLFIPWFKRIDHPTRPYIFKDLSLGTRRLVRLVLAIVTEPQLLRLVEHPEDGIHRALLRDVISLIKTYAEPGQVFLSSHSSIVLDELTPESIRLVSIASGKTSARALSSDELGQVRAYLEDKGNLSDFIEALDAK